MGNQPEGLMPIKGRCPLSFRFDRHSLAGATNTNKNPDSRLPGWARFTHTRRGVNALRQARARLAFIPCIRIADSALSSIRRAGAP